MKIESVRSLKAEIKQDILDPQSDSPWASIMSTDFVDGDTLPTSIPATFSLGISMRKGSDKQYSLAIRVQDEHSLNCPALSRIIKMAAGEVDVRFVGPITSLSDITPSFLPWYQQKNRPLCIGGSISNVRGGTGTLGAFVKKRGALSQERFMLSNNHVLGLSDAGRIGDLIHQPGNADGGGMEDRVGALAAFHPLSDYGNYFDAAIGSIDSHIPCDYSLLTGLGRLQGVAYERPHIGSRVAKIGRTTGLQRGVVTAIEVDNVYVGFPHGMKRFNDQMEIRGDSNYGFSTNGDSGSLVVNEDNRAVALLFSGSRVYNSTYVSPIQTVLDTMGLELLI